MATSIQRDIQTRTKLLQRDMTRLLSKRKPSITSSDFLTQFKQFFQVYGEHEYFEQVVTAILGEGQFPAATECMRAVVVNPLPGTVQKRSNPKQTEQTTYASDHGMTGSIEDLSDAIDLDQQSLEPQTLDPATTEESQDKTTQDQAEAVKDQAQAKERSSEGKRMAEASETGTNLVTSKRPRRTEHGKFYVGYFTTDHHRNQVPPLLVNPSFTPKATKRSKFAFAEYLVETLIHLL